MLHKYKTSKHLDKILLKLQNKDKKLYENVLNKINEVISTSNIEHYKNLRYHLKEYKRVQIGSFVLVFKYDKKEDLVYFDDFDHHDNIYKRA